MSNKNNNLIVSSVSAGILFVLAFVVLSAPLTTYAYKTQGAYTLTDTDPDNPVPVIYSLSSNSALKNEGAKNITITGSGFVPASVARYNGSARTTIYVSSTKLIMELEPGDTKVSGKYLINVFNPAPAGGYSNPIFFNVSNTVASGTAKTTGSVIGSTTVSGGTRVTSRASAVTKSATPASNTTSVANMSDDSRDSSNLTANASGSGYRFMPDTFLEWLFLCAFILLAVALWRKIYVTDKEAHAPLKHA